MPAKPEQGTVPLGIQASLCDHTCPVISLTVPCQSHCRGNEYISASLSDYADDLDVQDSGSSWKRPFDLVLEIAAFCAGGFELRTFLNLSLCCQEVYKELKCVLAEPVLLWDAKPRQSNQYLWSLLGDQRDGHHRDIRDEFPTKPSFWRKVQCVSLLSVS
jgi:hypothetical protein